VKAGHVFGHLHTVGTDILTERLEFQIGGDPTVHSVAVG